MLNKNTWACTVCGKAGKWVDCEVCLCEDKKVASMIRLTMSPSLLPQPMSQSTTSSSSVSMESEGAGPSNIIIASNNNIPSLVSTSATASSSSLQRLSDVVGGKQYSCDDCQESFSTKLSLKKHRLVHDIAFGRRIKCPHCDYNLNPKSTNKMTKHIRMTHSDEQATSRREEVIPVLRPSSSSAVKKVTIWIRLEDIRFLIEIKTTTKIASVLSNINNDYKRTGKLYKNGKDISELPRFSDCTLEDNDILEYLS